MQTEGVVHAISAGAAVGAARYFAGDAGSRGDYYLDPEGRRQEPPGRWLGDNEALIALGLESGGMVNEEDLLALMRGRHPVIGGRIRQPPRLGSAIVAHDVHWAPPKSVSLVWAYADADTRQEIERAFDAACDVGIAELQKLPLLRGYEGKRQVGMTGGLVVARFVHHTARLARGANEPDPQLHAHNLLLAGRRADGRWSALTNYHVMRNRARIDALVMGELAYRLRELGFEITPPEKGRWEVAGISGDLIERNSKRRHDIEESAGQAAAAVRTSMRNQYLSECSAAGRQPDPQRLREIDGFELDPVARRPLGRATRGAKAEIPMHSDLHRHWRERDGVDERYVATLRSSRRRPAGRQAAQERLARELTREAGLLVDAQVRDSEARLATASELELSAAAARLAAGDVRASEVEELTRVTIAQLVAEGRLIEVAPGRYATPAQLRLERQVLEAWAAGREDTVGSVQRLALERARADVERERGITLTDDQRAALEVMTGPGAVVAVTGDAGTGKGVTAAVAVRAWERSGHRVIGIAHANAIARRMEPLGARETMSVHMLLHRLERGRLQLDRRTVLLLDEATMVDTALMARLERARAAAAAKLILIGDDKQLGSIAAGGLFAVATDQVPHARLRSMVRYREQWLAEAVREQGEGRAERALAILKQHEALRWKESAKEARDEAVRLWTRAREAGAAADEVKIVVASSNRETDRLNRLVQAEREARGEVAGEGVELSGRSMEIKTGDLVIFREHLRRAGQARVVNGTTGKVVAVDKQRGQVRVLTDERKPRSVTVEPARFFRRDRQGGERESGLRAAYAIHVQPGQGMTVRHAIGITDWQSGRESATVQMSRGAESFVLVVNGGSPVLEHEREAAQSSLEAQLQLSTLPRAASDLRPERELSPLQRAVQDRQRAIGLTVDAHQRERTRSRERLIDRERER